MAATVVPQDQFVEESHDDVLLDHDGLGLLYLSKQIMNVGDELVDLASSQLSVKQNAPVNVQPARDSLYPPLDETVSTFPVDVADCR
jgi:hypothetical protein